MNSRWLWYMLAGALLIASEPILAVPDASPSIRAAIVTAGPGSGPPPATSPTPPPSSFTLPVPFKVAIPAPGTPPRLSRTSELRVAAPPSVPVAPLPPPLTIGRPSGFPVASSAVATLPATPTSPAVASASPAVTSASPAVTSANPVPSEAAVAARAARNHELLTHAVILAGLFSIDVGLNNSIQQHGFPLISEKAAGPLFLLGDGATDFMIAEGLHYLGGTETTRQAGVASTRAILNAGLNVQILKTLFGRANPGISANDTGQFTGPRLLSGHDSFPSGHTASAFAFATTMAHYYPKRKWFYYSLATLTGLSTMAGHVHWASDVYAGALIGIVSGNEALRRQPNLFFIKF